MVQATQCCAMAEALRAAVVVRNARKRETILVGWPMRH
jgi:hypothetical protein